MKTSCTLFIVAASFFMASNGCFGKEWKIPYPGNEAVSSDLPAGWRVLTKEEMGVFSGKEKSSMPQNVSLVQGFTLDEHEGDEGDRPFLLVLAFEGDRIPRERIQKMYSWLHGNEKMMASIFPTDAGNMSIEDIEFLPARPAIVFETWQQVGDRQLSSYSGILFLDRGYMNIVGYSSRESYQAHRRTFDHFFRSLDMPTSIHYPPGAFSGVSHFNPHAALAVLADNWQRIAGALIILAVYGYVFLGREKKVG